MIDKLIICVLLMVSTTVVTIAQDNKFTFTQKKPSDNGTVVYFHLKNIENETQGNYIAYTLTKDSKIQSARYFVSSSGKHRFQVYIDDDVTPEYIREIVKPFGVDFDFSTIAVNGIILNPEENTDLYKGASEKVEIGKDDFPEYIETGDRKTDEETYQQKKKEWVETHPEKYEELLKNNGN